MTCGQSKCTDSGCFLLACTTLFATGNIQKTNLVKLRKKVYTKYTHIFKKHSLNFPPPICSQAFIHLKKKKRRVSFSRVAG